MNIIYYLLALIGGIFTALQAGVNNRLKLSLESPVLTSLISFITGTIGLAIVYIFTVVLGIQTAPSLTNIKQTNWWMWTGGLFGAFFIFSTIVAVPKIGIANMLSLVVAAQMIMSVILDHIGALGSPVHTASLPRMIGLVLLIAGVYIIQTN